MPLKGRLNYGTIDQAASLVLVVVLGYLKRPPVNLEGHHVRARKHERGQGLSVFGNTHCRRNSEGKLERSHTRPYKQRLAG